MRRAPTRTSSPPRTGSARRRTPLPAPNTRKMRELSACTPPGGGIGLLLRRSGQPSRLKPVGRIVEVTRKFVRSVDKRQAGAANLWSRSVSRAQARQREPVYVDQPLVGDLERGDHR